MSNDLRQTVVLVGLMGVGKTTIGRMLADKLGCKFTDSDQEIETNRKTTIADIFEKEGEMAFRVIETRTLETLLNEGEPCVVSVGGGAFANKKNRQMIEQKACSVWLNADIHVLWDRLKDERANRPLLQQGDGFSALKDLAEKRTSDYKQAQQVVSIGAGLNEKQTVLKVLKALTANNVVSA